MFSADNSGLIIAWSTKVQDGSWHGAMRPWKIEKVKSVVIIIIITT